jgi:hypothetical protein
MGRSELKIDSPGRVCGRPGVYGAWRVIAKVPVTTCRSPTPRLPFHSRFTVGDLREHDEQAETYSWHRLPGWCRTR